MDAKLHPLNYWIAFLFYVCQKLTWKDWVIFTGLVSIPIWIIGMFFAFVVFPIVFNFFVIPNIEKKVGQSLDYNPYLSFTPLGRYFNRYLEISKYINNRAKALKKYNDHGLPEGFNLSSLKKVRYTIDMASKKEILLCRWAMINFNMTGIAFVIGAIAGIIYNH